jgi:hypothetical protein
MEHHGAAKLTDLLQRARPAAAVKPPWPAKAEEWCWRAGCIVRFGLAQPPAAKGAASSHADAMTNPFNAMTDPFTRQRAERRAEWRAILFLLGSAVFALAISYLARIAGADLTAVWAAAIR